MRKIRKSDIVSIIVKDIKKDDDFEYRVGYKNNIFSKPKNGWLYYDEFGTWFCESFPEHFMKHMSIINNVMYCKATVVLECKHLGSIRIPFDSCDGAEKYMNYIVNTTDGFIDIVI